MSAPLAVRRSPTHPGRVVAVAALTPRMRRISVAAPSLDGSAVRPAQDVELFLREESGRRVKRRYTIRAVRPEAAQLDLDVVIHGHGPGSRWAQSVQPGDAVEFAGPRGKLVLTTAPWHLLVGDESALPAIATICAALPPDEPAMAVVEVAGPAEEQDLGAAQVHWVHRDGAPAGGPERLGAAVSALALPPGGGHGYLMGETRAMVALREIVEARGLAHESIFVKGYWNLGRPDRLAGRRPE